MTDRRLTVLASVEQFPSRIQPWLLNTLEQVLVRGGGLWIVSGQHGDTSYPTRVDKLQLTERTFYLELGKVRSLANAMVRMVTPGRLGQLTRRGTVLVLKRGELFSGGAARIGNRLIKTPVYGLRDVDLVHSHALVAAYEYLEVAKALGVCEEPIDISRVPGREDSDPASGHGDV